MSTKSAPQGSIADRGYQHYDGLRLGTGHAVWTMVKASLQRAMGIKRPFRTKILPWLLLIAVYLPVIVLLAIVFLFRNGGKFGLPTGATYTGFYNGTALALILFAGLVAPDLLCPDRREHVLSLYFVAPITRLQYLVARCGALVGLLLLMSVVPVVLFYVGNASLSSDALGYMGNHLGDLEHVVLGGVLIAVYYTAIAVAVTSFHDRRAYAVGTYVGLMVVSAAASGILAGKDMHFTNHTWFALVNLLFLPLETVAWLFGQPTTGNLSGWAYLVSSLAVIGISGVIVSWQYRRMSAL